MNKKNLLRTCFFSVALVTALIPVVKGQEQPGTEAQTERVLNFLVINKETQKPIPNVELGIRIVRARSEDRTGDEGRCKIALGADAPDYVRLEVKKEGFVPIRLVWRKGPGRPAIPDQYTLALERGTSIGGMIHDEQGSPIEGVSVYLFVPGGNEVERVAIWDHVEKTDANGRWQCNIIPSKLDDIQIRLVHQDYISDGSYGATPRPSMDKLKAMTGVMVMKQYLTLAGRVFDVNDRPIEGALVAQGSNRLGAHYPSTKTDREGCFEFNNAIEDEMVLTVQAKGYAPDLKHITVHKPIKPLEFRLEPGHTLRGHIVDKQGNPVAGAFVAAESWRGHRSLKWNVLTDPNGCFQWDEAPPDEVIITISNQDYMSIRNYRISPSEQVHEITMPDILKIRGKVMDAETREPISEFKLISGTDWGEDQPISWPRRSPKTHTEGYYETQFTFPHPAYLIRIEADGYKPAISRPIGSNEGQVTIDFALEKGREPKGIVFLSDGTPAAGAEVILCTPSQGTYIQNGQQRRDGQYVETKEDGKFSFPVQTDVYAIVVLHDEGYLKISDSKMTESSDLVLQPWAIVKGKVLAGKHPVINEMVRLEFDSPSESSQPRIYHDYRTQTDNTGAFVFERAPPGHARISRMIRISERKRRYSHSTPVEAKAGQTVSITIGGMGRPVTGKIMVPDYLKEKFDWQYTDYGLRINASEGSYRQLGFKINVDGTFRIDDVPAGDYSLYVNTYAPPTDSGGFRGERIGLLSHHFTVPEMPNGRSDEPLDLGELELDVIGKSDYAPSLVGKSLPDLSDMNVDFALTQAKDKMMLVCFFDMNQRLSRHCIGQLAQQAKTFEDKGITIVVIQASKVDPATLIEWIKKSKIPFPVGRIETDEEKIRFAWGVKSLPWLILTDTEHAIRAEGFGLDELEEKIRESRNVRE